MEIFTVSALLLVVGLLTWLLIREKSQSAKALEQQAVTLRGAQLRQLDIIEKAFSQLRAADRWRHLPCMIRSTIRLRRRMLVASLIGTTPRKT